MNASLVTLRLFVVAYFADASHCPVRDSQDVAFVTSRFSSDKMVATDSAVAINSVRYHVFSSDHHISSAISHSLSEENSFLYLLPSNTGTGLVS